MRAAEFIVERKKRRRRPGYAAYGPGPYGGYGYYAGYSGDSGEGGDGGGGESIETEDAMMAKIEDDGKIVRILKKQHTVPFSDEKNWLLIDTDPAKGNKGLGLKWVPASTRFEWVRPYRDTVDENFAEEFTNYQGLRPPKNVFGTNLFSGQDIVGQRVYHCTNRLEAIKKSGGLKPRRDATGEREYGRLSTDEHPFIPVIGIWFSVGKSDWPGKHCVSFVIEPTDQVYVAYASIKGLKPNVVLNPIALDRLTIEGQQDVKENFADGRNPQDKGDSKRHGINTKAGVSSLRKTAKQGGRKGQLAHWLANMKAGRAKKNK